MRTSSSANQHGRKRKADTFDECAGCTAHIHRNLLGYSFYLSSCQHGLCVPCFSNASAGRGCDPFLRCPKCAEESSSWSLRSLTEEKCVGRSTRRRCETQVTKNVETVIQHCIAMPTLTKAPTQGGTKCLTKHQS